MKKINLKVLRLEHAVGLELPTYETQGASGMDLRCAIAEGEKLRFKPGERMAVPTGFCVAFDSDYEMQIRPRSGLAIKNGITCLNTPGTIDSDYRGEIKVILINLSKEEFLLERGMRIAQAVIMPIAKADIEEVSFFDNLEKTGRGTKGFGSTGVR